MQYFLQRKNKYVVKSTWLKANFPDLYYRSFGGACGITHYEGTYYNDGAPYKLFLIPADMFPIGYVETNYPNIEIVGGK